LFPEDPYSGFGLHQALPEFARYMLPFFEDFFFPFFFVGIYFFT